MTVTIAIYVEGNSDKSGLPILVHRTVQQILNVHGRYRTDVLAPTVFDDDDLPKSRRYLDRVVEVAEYTEGYGLLILHRDADHSTTRQAIRKYIEPARKRIDRVKAAGKRLCDQIVPVVPIREMEAWLLADPDALASVLDTDLRTLERLNLPTNIRQIESVPDPKQLLRRIVKDTCPGSDMDQLYASIADKIVLERLKQLDAYQEFAMSVTEVLRDQGMLAELR